MAETVGDNETNGNGMDAARTDASAEIKAGAFSMSLASKQKKQPAPRAAALGFESHAPTTSNVHEAVAEVVNGTIGKDRAAPVISSLPNTFNAHGRPSTSGDAPDVPLLQRSVVPKASADTVKQESAEVEAEENEDDIAARALLLEAASHKMTDDERYRADIQNRADVATGEEYESMPIEEFGKAMLRGMGWQEGVGLNGKGPVEPIEYVPRPQLLGMGATPKLPEKDSSGKKRFIKPGESREPKKDMIYVDADGKQRHIKRVGDKLVERGPGGFQPGALVAITDGAHKDLYARVVSTGGLDSSKKAILKLVSNGEQVQVALSQLQPVRDVQLERQRQGFTHEQAAGRSSSHGSRDDERKRRHADEKRESESARKSHKKHRKDHKSDSEHRDERGERDRRSRDHKEQKEHSEHKRSKEKHGGGSSGGPTWVREHIRVRVVDKRLRGGALYNKKGTVDDVSGANRFSMRMDDDGQLVEGLKMEQVETVLPKGQGAVLVVQGEHRLRRGRLLERDSKKTKAIVQLSGDFEVVECSYDDIAEWVGEEVDDEL